MSDVGKPQHRDRAEAAAVSDRLTALVRERAELFHGPNGEPYASVTVHDHRETFRVGSTAFRQWCARLLWEAEGRAPGGEAMASALAAAAAAARFDGPELPVAVRLAHHEGRTYLDLGGPAWRAVEVGPDGWRVVDTPPVRFLRPDGLQPLPEPERGGSIGELRPFLNVASDEDFLLLVAWLVGSLRHVGPYPILMLCGEQGSGKSSAARLLRSLLDPSKAGLRSPPREERDVAIACGNGWVAGYDNLSQVPDWLSDTLCRVSTGGGFGVRSHYTNDEETLFEYQRPVLMTSIAEVARRSDLRDRALVVTLPPIPDAARRPESELRTDWEAARPRILGALLDAVSCALRREPSLQLACLPRMADFARWVEAAAPSLGWQPGAFLAAYARSREQARSAMLDTPLVAALRGLLDEQEGGAWEGTATDLLSVLAERVTPAEQRSREWPGAPQVLSALLRRLAPDLRAVGIEYGTDRAARSRTHTLRRVGQKTVIDRHTVTAGTETTGICDAPPPPVTLPPALMTLPEPTSRACSDGNDGNDGNDASFPHSTEGTVTQRRWYPFSVEVEAMLL